MGICARGRSLLGAPYGGAGDGNSLENLRAEVERLRAELRRRERDTKNQQREHARQKRQIDGLQRQNEQSESGRTSG